MEDFYKPKDLMIIFHATLDIYSVPNEWLVCLDVYDLLRNKLFFR